MKKLIVLLAACLLFSLIGYSQSIPADKVPAPVTKAFATKFPAATDVNYVLKQKYYQVTCKDKGIVMSANFDPTGKWLKTETAITESDLPKEVTAAIAKDFAGFKISEVAKVEPTDKPLFYMLDLKKDKEGYRVHFSPKGDVVKKTTLKTPVKK